MPSLCHPSLYPLGPVSVFPLSPPRLPASFTRSTRHYRTGCCTLPFAAAAISCLSHARPRRRVSHSGAPTEDRSIFVTRSSRHARPRAGPIDRIISKPVAVSTAFASRGEAKERSKVIKSAIVLCNCRRID